MTNCIIQGIFKQTKKKPAVNGQAFNKKFLIYDILAGIFFLIIDNNFVMKMRPGRPSRVANFTDHIISFYFLPTGDQYFMQMSISGLVSVTVINNNIFSEIFIGFIFAVNFNDSAVGCCVNIGPPGS